MLLLFQCVDLLLVVLLLVQPVAPLLENSFPLHQCRLIRVPWLVGLHSVQRKRLPSSLLEMTLLLTAHISFVQHT